MSIKTYNDIDFDLTKIIENFARKGGISANFISGDAAKNLQRQADSNILGKNLDSIDIVTNLETPTYSRYKLLLENSGPVTQIKQRGSSELVLDNIQNNIDKIQKKIKNMTNFDDIANNQKKLEDLRFLENEIGTKKFDDILSDYEKNILSLSGNVKVRKWGKKLGWNKTINIKGKKLEKLLDMDSFRFRVKNAKNTEEVLNQLKGDIGGVKKRLKRSEEASDIGTGVKVGVIAAFITVVIISNQDNNTVEKFTQNNSPSPADELSEGEKTLKNIKADIDDTLMRMQVSINNKNLEKDQIKFEKELMAKLEYHERNSEFTIKEILDYMNIPTNFYEATLEQVIIMNSITSNDEIEEQEKLNTILIAREMYRRFDEDEKEKFLNASQEDQLTLIEIFIGDTEIKEDTENSENIESETTEKKPVVTNEIVEKTFLQKYMIVIIIGVIVLVGLLIFLMSGGKSDQNNFDF
jgi:hypothetical protein